MLANDDKINDQWSDPNFKAKRVTASCSFCKMPYEFYDVHPQDIQNNRIDCGCGTKACPKWVYWDYE